MFGQHTLLVTMSLSCAAHVAALSLAPLGFSNSEAQSVARARSKAVRVSLMDTRQAAEPVTVQSAPPPQRPKTLQREPSIITPKEPCEVPTEAPAAESPVAASDATPSPGQEASPGEVEQAAEPTPPAAPDIHGTRSAYHRVLEQRLRENRVYDAKLRRRGLEGTVRVRLTITRSGRIQHLEFVGEAPHRLLQQAAEATLRAAEPFPPIPSLLGDEQVVEVPIAFRLR